MDISITRSKTLFSAFFLYLIYDVTSASSGTTQNLREIFIGRCLDYQETGLGKQIDASPKDCIAIWESFFKAWGYKDPKTVVLADYKDFFELARQADIPENKTLLWSGTYAIAHAYSESGKRYVTLEDTLIGYLANGLTWCGVTCDNCTGINYSQCPDHQDLPVPARQAFWGGASGTFAGSAKGLVTIMVNGSDPTRPAYRPDSFMALFELPDLSKHVQLKVALVHDIDKIKLETCTSGSLLDMRNAIESHGFEFVCEENPEDIVHLLCVDYTQNEKCLLKDENGTTRHNSRLGQVLNIPTNDDMIGR